MARSFILVLAFLAQIASAEEETLQQRKERLLAEPFLTKAAWLTDYDKALAESKSSGKLIFAYLTRSYAPWLPCMEVEGGAFLEDAFVEFGKKVVLLCHVTTGIEGDPHQDLLPRTRGPGFPYIAMLDAEGAVVAQLQGKREVAGFDAMLARAQAYVEQRAKAASGDKAAVAEAFVCELEMGYFTLKQAREKLAGMELSVEQKARVDPILTNGDALLILRSVKDTDDQAKIVEAGKKCADMKKEGRVPTEERTAIGFHSLIMEYAESVGDPALFEESLGAVKAKLGDGPEAQAWAAKQDERLKVMREK